MNLGDLSDFGIEIDKRVADTISMMNEAKLSFGETMEYSKENYVLLRLANKMVKAQRRCKDKGIDFKVKIPEAKGRRFFDVWNANGTDQYPRHGV